MDELVGYGIAALVLAGVCIAGGVFLGGFLFAGLNP